MRNTFEFVWSSRCCNIFLIVYGYQVLIFPFIFWCRCYHCIDINGAICEMFSHRTSVCRRYTTMIGWRQSFMSCAIWCEGDICTAICKDLKVLKTSNSTIYLRDCLYIWLLRLGEFRRIKLTSFPLKSISKTTGFLIIYGGIKVKLFA